MPKKKIEVSRVEDATLRDILQLVDENFQEDAVGKADFAFFEISVVGAVTNKKVPHRLGFRPKDVIQTSKTGAGSLTWNYDQFDVTNLDITTTGTCVVRAFIGRYSEG